ncbi:MAG: peptidylprolyl isomerase [Oscillospiraceae bacterium]
MLKKIFTICMALCIATTAVGCGKAGDSNKGKGDAVKRGKVKSDEVQFISADDKAVTAVITTELGDITVALYPEYAPQAVENFIGLAKQGYYKDMPFHRVINDFLVQTGDADGTGKGGSTIWKNAPYPVEISDKLHHYSGALGMAHPDGKSLENKSQFYIIATQQSSVDDAVADKLRQNNVRTEVVDTYKQAGGAPYLDGLYTVFGQVTSGMDIVDKICAGAVEGEAPVTPIKLVSITIKD